MFFPCTRYTWSRCIDYNILSVPVIFNQAVAIVAFNQHAFLRSSRRVYVGASARGNILNATTKQQQARSRL